MKHTKRFSDKYYNEHPHKYNLYGISKMLSNYKIENAATTIKDKENDIFNIETPFIAHAGGDFVIVHKVQQSKIQYISNNLNISLLPTDFCELWSGIILLVETNSESIEPNYKINRRKEIFQSILNSSFILILSLLLIKVFIVNQIYSNFGLILLALINLIGLYICYLILKKQMKVSSQSSDRICSLFKQNHCNDILESDASKILGLIGWGEIGFGYFISNIVLILFCPQLISYLALINICALPYSFWSVWYQKVKAKQWCPLCLTILVLLWTLFIVNLFFGYIQIPILGVSVLLSIISVYLIPQFAINALIYYINKSLAYEHIMQEINSIKSNEDVFLTLLKKQPYYKVDKNTSGIIFGNLDADILVTILTNPHCEPCAKMHKRVEKMISHTDKLCIQYIFSSFDDNLDPSNKFLTAVYMSNSLEKTREIYAEWFERGKYTRQHFFELHHMYVTNNDKIETEFRKHKEWKEQTRLRATPVILVNGYKLPENYKLEDLEFFPKIDVNSR